MIAYLRGKIAFRSAAFLVVDVGGVGYHVNIPLSTYTATEGKEEAVIFTHHASAIQVNTIAHQLYGFATETERHFFQLLISVKGVGASSALLLLSAMTVDDIRGAILSEQAHVLQRAKGIGPKVAKQIILDLKDKISREGGGPELSLVSGSSDGNMAREEALSALMSLGFNRIAVQKALNSALRDRPTASKVEELIKLALKHLS